MNPQDKVLDRGGIEDRPMRGLQWRVVFLCALVTIFDGFDVQSISFAGPAISAEFDIPRWAFGTIFSAGIAGMLIGLICQGPIADRWGRRPMILLSVATFALASLATIFATSVTAFVCLRLIAGLGMGAVIPNVTALTTEYAPLRSRSRLVVLMGSGLPIGGLLGGVMSAHLIDAFGWHAIFVFGGVGPLCLLPLLWLFLPESLPFLARRGDQRSADELRRVSGLLNLDPSSFSQSAIEDPAKASRGSPLLALFSHGRGRDTGLLWLIFMANMLIFYFLIGWSPMLLTHAGMPMSRAGLVMAGLNLGSVVGGLVLGWLADRWGGRPTLTCTFCLAAILLFLLGRYAGADFALVAGLALLLGLASGGAQLVLNAVAASRYPVEIRASGIGAAGMAGRLGAIAGPMLGGMLIARGFSVEALCTLLVAPALLAAGGAAMMSAAIRRSAREPKPRQERLSS